MGGCEAHVHAIQFETSNFAIIFREARFDEPSAKRKIETMSGLISHFLDNFKSKKLTDKIPRPQHRAPHAVWWHWPRPNLGFPWALAASRCCLRTTGNTNRKIHHPAISTTDDPSGRTSVTCSPCSTPGAKNKNKSREFAQICLNFTFLKTNLFFDERRMLILHIDNRHNDTTTRTIYMNKMHQPVDVLENCIGFFFGLRILQNWDLTKKMCWERFI